MYLKISNKPFSTLARIWSILLIFMIFGIWIWIDQYAIRFLPFILLIFIGAYFIQRAIAKSRQPTDNPLYGLDFLEHNLEFVRERQPIAISYDALSVVLTIHLYQKPLESDDGDTYGYRPAIHHFQFDFDMQDKTLLPLTTVNYPSEDMNLIFKLLALSARLKHFSYVFKLEDETDPSLQKHLIFIEKQINSYIQKGTYTTLTPWKKIKRSLLIIFFVLWLAPFLITLLTNPSQFVDFFTPVLPILALISLPVLLILFITWQGRRRPK